MSPRTIHYSKCIYLIVESSASQPSPHTPDDRLVTHRAAGVCANKNIDYHCVVQYKSIKQKPYIAHSLCPCLCFMVVTEGENIKRRATFNWHNCNVLVIHKVILTCKLQCMTCIVCTLYMRGCINDMLPTYQINAIKCLADANAQSNWVRLTTMFYKIYTSTCLSPMNS